MVSHSYRSQNGTRVPNLDMNDTKEGREGRSGRKPDKGGRATPQGARPTGLGGEPLSAVQDRTRHDPKAGDELPRVRLRATQRVTVETIQCCDQFIDLQPLDLTP